MKPQTRAARAMSDEALSAGRLRLRREIAAKQSLMDAMDREARRRRRALIDRRARPKSVRSGAEMVDPSAHRS